MYLDQGFRISFQYIKFILAFLYSGWLIFNKILLHAHFYNDVDAFLSVL